MILIKNYSQEKLPKFAYFVWIVCLIFNFYMYLVQLSAWELTSNLPFYIAIIFLQLPVAFLIDKFGPRYMTAPIILLSSLGILFLSHSSSEMGFSISAFMIGIGGTVTTVSTLKIVSNWFLPKRFTIMLAWTLFFMTLTAMVGKKLAFALISYFAWTKMMSAYGIIGVFYAVLFFTCVRDFQIGLQYRLIPNPKNFNLIHTAKRALTKRENYLLALFFGIIFTQWLIFYVNWHTRFYQSTFHLTSYTTNLLTLVSMSCFAIGVIFFLYLASFFKKRKIFMLTGLILAIFMNLFTIYMNSLSFISHVTLDCLTAFCMSTSALAYTLTYEKNAPAVSGTVMGLLLISLTIFYTFGEYLIQFMKEAFSNKQLAIVIPISLVSALTILFFIKETYGRQIYEE